MIDSTSDTMQSMKTPGARLERILVAIDFRPDSIAAARWAARYLAPGSDLRLVHAVHVPEPYRGASAEAIDALRTTTRVGAEARLTELAASLPATRVSTLVLSGEPRDVICQAAREWKADLLVLGRHGERPGLWEFLGGTADGLLDESPVSVLVAGGMKDAAPSRVLVGVDEHGISPELHAWLALLYRRFAPEFTLLYVVGSAVPSHALAASGDTSASSYEPTSIEVAEHESDRWADALCAGGAIPRDLVHSEAAWGEAGSELVMAAERTGSDLIVVDRRHGGRVRRALLGSVSREVVRAARRPVLVVRHADDHAVNSAADARETKRETRRSA